MKTKPAICLYYHKLPFPYVFFRNITFQELQYFVRLSWGPHCLEANLYFYTKCIGSLFLAREASQPNQPSFVARVSDPQRRSARSGSESKRKSHQKEKWQNFHSSGPGHRESGGEEGEEGEEGTGVRVKGPQNQLERKRVCSFRLRRTDLTLYTTRAFTQAHFHPFMKEMSGQGFPGIALNTHIHFSYLIF